MKTYEALFIIDPGKESSLKEITSSIGEAIAKGKGKITKEENWGKQRLEHLVKKNRDGIYYKLEFTIDPLEISTLNASYRLNPDILRLMITAK